MESRGNKAPKKILNVLVFLCAVTAVALTVAGYLHLAHAQEQTRINRLAYESAAQSAALIRERITNSAAYLENIGHYLGEHNISIVAPETLEEIQNDKGEIPPFEAISVATTDGTLHGPDGRVRGNIATHAHFRATMLGETTISNLEQSLDGRRDIICITAPIVRDNQIIGVVGGRVMLPSLAKLLSDASFGGHSCSYLANTNGQVFVRADNANTDAALTNIYESFQKNPTVSNGVLARMRQDMQNGKAGCVSYRCDGNGQTMNYMPLAINNWYLLSVLPNEIISSYSAEMKWQMLFFIGSLIGILLLLIFYSNAARRKEKGALKEAHEKLLMIYNTIPVGVFKCRMDTGFTLLEANDGFYRFIEYTKEALAAQFSNRLGELLQPDDLQRVRQSLAKQLQTGQPTRDEVRFGGADGRLRWILLCGEIRRSRKGDAQIYCCFTDITELKQMQEELRKGKQRYDLITEGTQNVIFEWNILEHTIYHSPFFEKKFGYPCRMENFPRSILEQHLIFSEDEQCCADTYRRIEEGERFSTGEFRIKKLDGTYLWCRVSITAVLDQEGPLCRAVGVITDIDYLKRELYTAMEKSQQDAMTELYNKAATEQLIAQRLRMPIASAVLLTVDLDDFKAVNDTLGHAGGDRALIEVAHQLKSLFRSNDIVGRVGGDEFMVFAEGLEMDDCLQKKLTDIAAVFNWSFRKNDTTCVVSCSIGVAICPRHGSTYEELSKRADAALYFAKQNGKNQVAIYRSEMKDAIHGIGEVQSLREETL